MSANYNCLLFDVDGTLLDFNEAEHAAILGTLGAFDLPQDDATAALFSHINADLWEQLSKGAIKKEKLLTLRFEKLLRELGAKGDAGRLNTEFVSRLSNEAPLIPGADEILEELAEFATLAAISNGLWQVQLSRLKSSGLDKYFDDIFVSERMGVTKPAARFFDMALQKLGVTNRQKVLVIGNSLSADIKGGQNANLATCWCNFAGEENPGEVVPTYTVQSFMELKLVAVGEEELKNAAVREKKHMV